MEKQRHKYARPGSCWTVRGPRGGKCGRRAEVGIAGPWGRRPANLGQRLSPGWEGPRGPGQVTRGWPGPSSQPRRRKPGGAAGGTAGPLLCLHRLAHSPGGPGKIHGLKNQFGFHGQPEHRPSPLDRGVGSPQGRGEARPDAEALWPAASHGKGGSRDVWGQRPEGGAPALWLWDPGQPPQASSWPQFPHLPHSSHDPSVWLV